VFVIDPRGYDIDTTDGIFTLTLPMVSETPQYLITVDQTEYQKVLVRHVNSTSCDHARI